MSMSLRSLAVSLVVLVVPLGLLLPGCGDSDASPPPKGNTGGQAGTDAGTGGAGGSGNTGGTPSGVCALNNCACPASDPNCDADDLCSGCTFGRTTCLIEGGEGRCVACNPATGQGCPEGQECSSFGTCKEKGATCPTDNQGTPTISCQANKDCQACDPAHQICDSASSQCVQCTETNTSLCPNPTDSCIDGKCALACPASCSTDNDCNRCETQSGKKAAGCFKHVCAECSETYACPAGLECKQGQCVKPCGLPGSTSGACTEAAHCAGCGAEANPWQCKFPLNGGVYGTCSPSATGCSDLGPGVAVLPPPYDKVTNLCSNNQDCNGVGIQYNVGEAIRDLVGGPQLDIGIKKIDIKDAIVNYGMPACASVKLTENVSCGLCVPCKQHSDCKKIEVDQLVSDLFQGDPLATIAGAMLIELLYGSNDDHSLHFQCLPVAGGYGVCIPCGNPLKSCTGTTSGGSGQCNHSECSTGGPLDTSCNACTAAVCAEDAFCCTTEWDQLCVNAANQLCPSCSGSSGPTCAHSACAEGDALSPLCSPCVKAVCDDDPFCCDAQFGEWDDLCVDAAETVSSCNCP